jgi:hypothetical protein
MRNEMGVACGPYGGVRGQYRVLVGTPEGKSSSERPTLRWEGVDLIYLDNTKDKWWLLLNTVMNFPVP